MAISTEVQRSLDVFWTALGTEKLMLKPADADLLEACMRGGVYPPDADAAVKQAVAVLHATIDHLRLDLFEEDEADLMRALEAAGYPP